MTKRIGGQTIHAIVYRTVKLSPKPMTARAVCELSAAVTLKQCRDALGEMCKRGLLVRHGSLRTATYSRVPGAVRPKDGRGQQPASKEALRCDAVRSPATFPKRPVAVPGIALDEFWPLPTFQQRVLADSIQLATLRGEEARPEFGASD
jgi:hypothetical protein